MFPVYSTTRRNHSRNGIAVFSVFSFFFLMALLFGPIEQTFGQSAGFANSSRKTETVKTARSSRAVTPSLTDFGQGVTVALSSMEPAAVSSSAGSASPSLDQEQEVQSILSSLAAKKPLEKSSPAVFDGGKKPASGAVESLHAVAGTTKERNADVPKPVIPFAPEQEESPNLLATAVMDELSRDAKSGSPSVGVKTTSKAPAAQAAPVAQAVQPTRGPSDASEGRSAGRFPSLFGGLLKMKDETPRTSMAKSTRKTFFQKRPQSEPLASEETAVGAKQMVGSHGYTKPLSIQKSLAADSPAPKPGLLEAKPLDSTVAGEDLILGSLKKEPLREETMAEVRESLRSRDKTTASPTNETNSISNPAETELAAAKPAETELAETELAAAKPAKEEASAVLVPAEDSAANSARFQSPVLEIKTTSPKRIMVGQESEYAIKIRNTSGVAANELIVRTAIPANVEIAGIQPTVGTSRVSENTENSEQTLCLWKVGVLDPEKEESLLIRFVPRVRNNIDFVSDYECQKSIVRSGIEVQEPILELNIEGRETIDWGIEDKYRMQIRNTGNGEAENIHLTVATGDNDSATRILKNLAPGEEKTMEINIKTILDGTLDVRVEAVADYGFTAKATKTIEILRGHLDVFVEAPEMQFVNDTVDYLIHVNNTGRAILQDVEVVAAIPPTVDFVTCSGDGQRDETTGRLLWKIPMIKPEEEVVYQVTGRMIRAGASRMDVTAADKTGVSSTGEAQVMIEAIAALKMNINKPTGPIAIGSEVEYEVVISNNGTKAAEQIDAGFFLPEGLTPKSVEGGGLVVPEESKVLFSKINFLGPGQSVAYKVHAEAVRPGNHKVQAVLESRPDDIQLVTEEMNYFYERRTVAKRTTGGSERLAMKSAPAKEPVLAAPSAAAEKVGNNLSAPTPVSELSAPDESAPLSNGAPAAAAIGDFPQMLPGPVGSN